MIEEVFARYEDTAGNFHWHGTETGEHIVRKQINNEIERIEEERFVKSLISLWIQPDAPEWIIDYVRTELRKQRGLLEEKDLKVMKKVNGIYSEDIMNSLVNLMKVFLKDHEIYKLMELVAGAVATKEQENSHKTCTGVSSIQDLCNPLYMDKVGGNCPVCGLRMARSHKYCHQCGQKMNWD